MDDNLEDARFTIINDTLHVLYTLANERIMQCLTPYSNENEKIDE